MKIATLILLFCLPLSLFSQECWQCLSNAQSGNPEKAIEVCSAALAGTNSAEQSTVIGFVLAREYMNTKNFSKAYELLNKLKTTDPAMNALITGLKGDCCTELGRDNEAVGFYKAAAGQLEHDWITPWFLFKAGALCRENGNDQEAYRYFQTIENKYKLFSQQWLTGKYIDPQLDRQYHFNAKRTALNLPEGPLGLGVINGQQVDAAAFNAEAQQQIDIDRNMFNSQQRVYTATDMEQSLYAAWDNMTTKQLLHGQQVFPALQVTSAELMAYLAGEEGFPLLPEIGQSFVDETHRFSKERLVEFIDVRKNAADKLTRDMWQMTENVLGETLLEQKFIQLQQYGLYVTTRQARSYYHELNDQLTVEAVFQSYSSVSEGQLQISEAEIRNYYRDHQAENKYDPYAGRDLLYFDIPFISTRADSLDFVAELNKLKAEFKKTRNDSLFVLQHSETQFYISNSQATFVPEGDSHLREGMTYSPDMQPLFDQARKGDVIGPYVYNGRYRLVKVLGFNKQLITARHILIASSSYDSPEERANKRKTAESLLKEINQANFEEYVRNYSEDPGSKENGGIYTDFMDFEMVQPFADYGVKAPIGKIGIVETDFGYHIMEVLERKKVNYPILAIIEKTLVPSAKRKDEITAYAQSLLQLLNDTVSGKTEDAEMISTFKTLVSSIGFFPRQMSTHDVSPKIATMVTPEASNALLHLLYDEHATIGRFCNAPVIDGERLLIGMVSSIRKGDSLTYADAREQMKTQLITEKKAEYLRKRSAEAVTVAEIAESTGEPIQGQTLNLANPSVSDRFEPQLAGTLFHLRKPGTVLLQQSGFAGLYSVRIVEFEAAAEKTDYSEEQSALLQLIADQTNYELIHSLQKQAGVIDNRLLFELGIRR